MTLDLDVEALATLARLDLEPGEVERLTGQLRQILEYMGMLDELGPLPLDEVPPTSHALDVACPTRADGGPADGSPDALLERAPSPRGRFYAVPRVIE